MSKGALFWNAQSGFRGLESVATCLGRLFDLCLIRNLARKTLPPRIMATMIFHP